MARILRGVKSPFASSAWGGVGVLLCGGVPMSPCQSLRPVSLAPLLPACGVLWAFPRCLGPACGVPGLRCAAPLFLRSPMGHL